MQFTQCKLTGQKLYGLEQGGGVLLQNDAHVGQQRVRLDASRVDHITMDARDLLMESSVILEKIDEINKTMYCQPQILQVSNELRAAGGGERGHEYDLAQQEPHGGVRDRPQPLIHKPQHRRAVQVHILRCRRGYCSSLGEIGAAGIVLQATCAHW